MTKKFTLMMLFLLLFGAASFSQTASLATVTASPGQNVPVALNVTGFTGIGSITFYIRFKPSVMTFTGTSNPSMGVSFLAGVTDSTINIVWTGFPYVSFPDGKLLDLNFTYYGMTTSPLNFLGNCEVTQGVTVIHPTYTNGSVSMAVVPQTATIIAATAATGSLVSVPIQYLNMPGAIGAVTQVIHYDPTKLTFVSVVGGGTLAVGTNYSVNTSTGVITIAWANIGGTNINYGSGNLFMLNFIYIGSTVTNLDFMAGSIISTTPGAVNVPVTYYGGTISMSTPTATAVLGSITGAHQGQDYNIPMTFGGFPSGVAGGVQAFTLTIPYDYPRLSYLGLLAPVPGLIVSQASGTLTFAWSNTAGPSINGAFITLKFKYNGIGTANISFGNGCVFTTYNAGVTGTVQVAYTNGSITPAIEPATATLGTLQAAVGANVLVPINFTGLPANNMGAVTLKIMYDYNKLTFIDAQNNTYGANVALNPTTHIITVAWNSVSAIDLNVKFLDLRFTYNGGGGGGCGSGVNFTDGCELANFAAVIVPTNWVNGGVNLLFKVSGILTYNSDPNPPIPLVGYTVYLNANPGGPLQSTVTDGTGAFSFWTGNGNYSLSATPSPLATWNADLFDVVAMFDYTNSIPIPDQNALRVKAGDVNQNGDIDLFDVVLLFDRVANSTIDPEYTAPDFAFSNPVFTVNCADIVVNFMGLSSGNVLGSNPTP